MNIRTNRDIILDKNIVLTERVKKVTQKNIYSKYIKRVCDIIISSIALIILSPLFLIIGILIKIESKGPVFFLHERVGKKW